MFKKQIFLIIIILTIILSLNIISAHETTSHNTTSIESKDNVSSSYSSNNMQINKNTEIKDNTKEFKSANTIDTKSDIKVNTINKQAYSGQNISFTCSVKSKNSNNVNIPTAILKINNKTVSKNSVTNGTVKFNFIVPYLKEGNHTITIKTDETPQYKQGEVNKTLSIYKRNVTINSKDINSFAGKNITLNVNVKTASGKVNNSKIILKIANKSIVSSTVENGLATFKFTTPDLKAGIYDMLIKTNDNVLYNSANITQRLTIYRQNVTISATDITSYAGKTNTLNVKITTKGIKSTNNIPIVLKINNSIVAKTKINSNIVTFNFTTPYLKRGNYPITIKTEDSAFYNAALITKKLTIYPRNITITTNTLTGYIGKKASLVANFNCNNKKANISYSILKINNQTLSNQEVIDGVANYSFIVPNLKEGKYILTIKTGNTILYNNATKLTTLIVKNPLKSNIFANSIQAFKGDSIQLKVNVTDELNNTVTDGSIDLYLNKKKIETKAVSSKNVFTIEKQDKGVYNVKLIYDSDKYESATKDIKLTVNPKSNYKIKIVNNPSLFSGKSSKIRVTIRNANKGTINDGIVKFYFNNKYQGSSDTKNNLSSLKISITEKEGDYPVKTEYYLNNKFIGADSQYLHVNKNEAQKEQNVFITLAGDLISNSKISSTKKDVYFAMDRTTASYDYSPNDMKIMNNIAYNLRCNGFNVKRIKNGPGETYNTAKYMYNNKVKNSICFILCNGVDANVIREYLKGYDNMLTKVRNRGNDIVMGWFYGAGDIYNPDGEYYYWLNKAWDDNYSKWGGMSNPRKTAEKDGIKIVYEKDDLKGNKVAKSFVKLYGGKITEKVGKNTTLSLKTNIYTTNSQKISGNIVYTLNDKIIKNVTVTGNTYTLRYKMPDITGTYHLKATYYSKNKIVCTTDDRYLKIS